MKSYLSLSGCLLLALSSFAQMDSAFTVKFEKGTIEEAQAKARKENKMLFVYRIITTALPAGG